MQNYFERVQKCFEREQKHFERVEISFERVEKSFERVENYFERVQKCFETRKLVGGELLDGTVAVDLCCLLCNICFGEGASLCDLSLRSR